MNRDDWQKLGWALVFFVLVALILLSARHARAEEPDWSAWFKGLKQPQDVSRSCCDISDCKRTTAKWRDGQWHALLPDGKTEIPVPPGIVIEEKAGQGPYGEAVLCSAPNISPPLLYCFVPPATSF